MRHSRMPFLCLIALCLTATCLSVLAQDTKPNLSGKWQFNSGKSEMHGKTTAISLVIEQKGPSIHLTKTMSSADGKDTVMEFNCTTDGKDCDAKGSKVSLWYDGKTLIEMDIGTDVVSKSSMMLDPGGKTISLTVSYISPPGESDKAVLDKV